MNRSTQELSDIVKVSRINEIGVEHDILNLRMEIGTVTRNEVGGYRGPEEYDRALG